MSSHHTKRRRHISRKWHRWLGLIAAVPILWLAISGIMLNHADRLGLNERMVTNGWILKHYNQLPEGEPYAFQVGDRLVTGWGGELFLDEKLLPLQGDLVGATAFKGQLIIATPDRVGVFDGADEMLLELDELSLPGLPVEGVGLSEEKLHLKVTGRFFVVSEDFFSTEKVTQEFAVVQPRELLPEERETLTKAIRTHRGMPLWRVITDAHSGSLFGWAGWVMTDLAGISLIILTLLGLRLFPKRKS